MNVEDTKHGGELSQRNSKNLSKIARLYYRWDAGGTVRIVRFR